MLKKILLLSGAAFLALAPLSTLNARVIEIRKKTELNPTVYFSGLSGNQAFTREMNNFLGVCGWFDVTNRPEGADYVVNAENSGGRIIVRLIQSKKPIAAWSFPASANARDLAKTAVDTIIERVFEQLKVRSFCRSKIAFTAQSAPGIRNVFVCDIDGGNIQQITNYRSLNVEPGWSPDGRTLYFSKYNSSGISIVETTVATPRRSRVISNARGINTGAAISPDGQYMAVILSPDRQVDLYVLGLGRKYLRHAAV